MEYDPEYPESQIAGFTESIVVDGYGEVPPYPITTPVSMAQHLLTVSDPLHCYNTIGDELLTAARSSLWYSQDASTLVKDLQQEIVASALESTEKAAQVYRKYADTLRKISKSNTVHSPMANDVLTSILMDTQIPMNELETPYWVDGYTGENIQEYSEETWWEKAVHCGEIIKYWSDPSPTELAIDILKNVAHPYIKADRWIELNYNRMEFLANAMDNPEHPARKASNWEAIYAELKKLERRYNPKIVSAQWTHYACTRKPYADEKMNKEFISASTRSGGDMFDDEDTKWDDRGYIPPPIQAGQELNTTIAFNDLRREYFEIRSKIYENGPWQRNSPWPAYIVSHKSEIKEVLEWSIDNYPWNGDKLTATSELTDSWIEWKMGMLQYLFWHFDGHNVLMEWLERKSSAFVEDHYTRMNAKGEVENHISKKKVHMPIDICTIIALMEQIRFVNEDEMLEAITSQERQFFLDNGDALYKSITNSGFIAKGGDPTPDEIDKMTKGYLKEYAYASPPFPEKMTVVGQDGEPAQVKYQGREWQYFYMQAITTGSAQPAAKEIAWGKWRSMASPAGQIAYTRSMAQSKTDNTPPKKAYSRAWGSFYGASRRAKDAVAIPIKINKEGMIVKLIAEEKEVQITWKQAIAALAKNKLILYKDLIGNMIDVTLDELSPEFWKKAKKIIR